MTARYNGWLTSRGVTPANAELVNRVGRVLLAFVMQQRKFSNVGVYSAKKYLADGSLVIASYDGHTPIIRVVSAQQTRRSLDTVSMLWLPRGFVVWPGSDASNTGWGTPVIQAPAESIFAPANTAPGLDTERWTPGGGLHDVLITQQVGAGYPQPIYGITPAFYSANEAPSLAVDASGNVVGKGTTYKPPALGDWTAYRVEFDNFEINSATALQRQAFFSTLRSSTDYLLPLRGYYDLATRACAYAVSADFSASDWISDATLSAAPTGYGTFFQRSTKDGTVELAHETIAAISDPDELLTVVENNTHLNDSTFVQNRTSLDVGIANSLTTVSAQQRAQWIACGVRFWIGDDPALPVVSWDGYPCQNWPGQLISGAAVGGAYADFDHYTLNVRGSAKPIFSGRICANGRVIGSLPMVSMHQVYVLSAGVQKTEVGDRLVVIGWCLADQDPFSAISEYNRIVRCYFVDIPRRNGLALLPAHSINGLYDAATNPDGWHYGGTFSLWVRRIGDFQGIVQPPQFRGDGLTIGLCVLAFAGGFFSGTYWQELLFNSIADGATSVTITGDDWRNRTEPAITNNASILAFDYVPSSSAVRAIFYLGLGIPRSGFVIETCVRWSGAGNGSNINQQPNDLITTDSFHDGYQFSMFFALDALTGAMLSVNTDTSSTHFKTNYTARGQVVATSTPITVSGGPYGSAIENFSNDASVVLTSFARQRTGETIAGYEVQPLATYCASFFDSSIGDIGALTQTPGTGLRLYPVGAV